MSNKDIDKGWAWVVLIAASTSLGICSMPTASIGIFQVEFLEIFKGSTRLISMICSLHAGFQLFLGPVASIICNTFSIRVGAMLGASVLSLGFLLSALSSSFEELLLFFGLIAGGGFSIMYASVSVICSHYFHDKRLIACGITFATPGIGYLSGPTLTRYLIDKVGWRSTLGIYSCMTAQICVLGSLFFPMNEYSKRSSSLKGASKNAENGKVDSAASVPLTSSFSPKRTQKLKSEKINIPCSNKQTVSLCNGESKMEINVSVESVDQDVLHQSPNGVIPSPVHSTRNCYPKNDINSSLSSVNSQFIHDRHRIANKFITSIQTMNSLSQRNGSGSGSLMWQSHWSMQHVGTYLAQEEAQEAGEDIEKPTSSPDFSVLKNKSIWCLSLSQFLMMCGCGINIIHFPSMLVSNGIDISIVPQFYMTQGICVIIARIVGGLFCSSPDINILVVYFGCQLLLGVSVFCVPFFGSRVWAYHLFQVAYAMYYGGSYVVLSQILVKLLGLRRLATGFGLQMMMAGIAFFMTPTLAGWLYDITGSYNFAYHCAGSVIFLGSFFVLIIQVLEPLSFNNEPHQSELVVEIEELNPEKNKVK